MKVLGNTGIWSGHFGIILVILAGITWGIYCFGDYLGLTSFLVKIYVFLGLCVVVFLLRYGGQVILFFRNWHKNKEAPAASQETDQLAQTCLYTVTLSELKQALRYHYGRFWRRKITVLILTGSAQDVEQLTPGLSTQLWQEDQGTLLLWGGVPGESVDFGWFHALRKLRHCPADGLVWMTGRLVGSEDETSASFLEGGVSGPDPTDTLYYLGQKKILNVPLGEHYRRLVEMNRI